jgi:radical SAM superfamily enzyme YgiQ (UPF0313 family)
MKVLLINPPRQHEIIGNNPALIDEERGCNPPLGILYIAAYLEKHTDYQVSVLDCQVESLAHERIADRVQSFAPDVVGISAMTMTMIDVVKTIAAAKKGAPKAEIVLGGPHVHLFPDETISLANVDYLVLGEGEKTFAALLGAMGKKKELAEIPGIVFRSNKKIVKTDLSDAIEDLDEIPFPSRHLVPYKKYSSLLSIGETVTTIFTSRGCPFKCRFCDRPHLGKRFRARSAKNTVDELEACVKMGIKEFLVYDDTFTVNKQRVLDICDDIIGRKLKISFDIRARVDTINAEMLKKLKAAGCQGIHYGVEAGTPKVLETLKKGITLEKAKEIFDLTKKHRISTLAYFMIGSPGETREDILETFRVSRWLNPDYIHLTILTPFPGTQIYFEALERGIIKTDVWREFAANPTPDFRPPYWNELHTKQELEELIVLGYRQFYLRPKYIVRRLMQLKSLSELKKKAKAGLKVFTMRGSGAKA